MTESSGRIFHHGELSTLGHVEKFLLGQDRNTQRPGFVQLAPGVFHADEVIGVLRYRVFCKLQPPYMDTADRASARKALSFGLFLFFITYSGAVSGRVYAEAYCGAR